MKYVNSYSKPRTEDLPAGTMLLQGQYRIERFINCGGFGMTYLARDSLNRPVVIKECFPSAFCERSGTNVIPRHQTPPQQFSSIVRHFVREAHRLAKLHHPNILGVHQVFEDNQTAYMALDYIDGRDLHDIAHDKVRYLGPMQIKDLLLKILDAVYFTHCNGLLHRDISPDNILLNRDGVPVLIDFGAARESEIEKGKALSELLAVKEGYSPQEFYVAGSVQGPFSDLYALGATFYHLITGAAPINSQDRMAAVAAGKPDPYQPLDKKINGYSYDFLASLDKALQLFPKDRFQSAKEWAAQIDPSQRQAAALARAESDESIRATIRKLITETDLIDPEQDLDATSETLAVHPSPEPQKRTGTFGLIVSLFSGTNTRKSAAP